MLSLIVKDISSGTPSAILYFAGSDVWGPGIASMFETSSYYIGFIHTTDDT